MICECFLIIVEEFNVFIVVCDEVDVLCVECDELCGELWVVKVECDFVKE